MNVMLEPMIAAMSTARSARCSHARASAPERMTASSHGDSTKREPFSPSRSRGLEPPTEPDDVCRGRSAARFALIGYASPSVIIIIIRARPQARHGVDATVHPMLLVAWPGGEEQRVRRLRQQPIAE